MPTKTSTFCLNYLQKRELFLWDNHSAQLPENFFVSFYKETTITIAFLPQKVLQQFVSEIVWSFANKESLNSLWVYILPRKIRYSLKFQYYLFAFTSILLLFFFFSNYPVDDCLEDYTTLSRNYIIGQGKIAVVEWAALTAWRVRSWKLYTQSSASVTGCHCINDSVCMWKCLSFACFDALVKFG